MLTLSPAEMIAHGLPSFGVSADPGPLVMHRFPEPTTIAALAGPDRGLPRLVLAFSPEGLDDAASLAAFLDGRAFDDLELVALGEPGQLVIAGGPHPALPFEARTESGVHVAACAAAIRLAFDRPPERPSVVAILAVKGDLERFPTPEAVAAESELALVVASLRLETGAPGASDARRARRLEESVSIRPLEAGAATLALATPLEAAAREIEALRAALHLARPSPRAADAARRERLRADLDGARARAERLAQGGRRAPRDRSLALAVAAFAGLDADDPLATAVESTLRRIVGLLQPA